jgi:hypothetical protein
MKGSSPLGSTILWKYSSIGLELSPFKRWVQGSSPCASTINNMMKFSDYYTIVSESYFLSELSIIAQKYDIAEAQALERKLQDAGVDMAKEYLASDIGDQDYGAALDYHERTELINSLRDKVLQALIVIHETEYKLSQIKKYGGTVDLTEINSALMKLAQYCKHYIMGVMSIRIAVDISVLNSDVINHKPGAVKKLMSTSAATIWPDLINFLKKQALHSKKFKKTRAYDLVYLDMLNAKTLPEVLIAVSKGLNAVHDSGPLLQYDDGDDNVLTYQPPFTSKDLSMLSNLNYRKLDRELQQELAK